MEASLRVMAVEEPLGFEAFFAESHRRVAGMVALATGTTTGVDDHCQEAYARAFQRWARIREYERPDLWVLRVALNLAQDARRRPLQPLADDTPARDGEESLLRALWVEWSLDRLSPMQRATVVLHHIEGRDLDEVARLLGRSRSTIKSHLDEGRRRLRKLLGGRQ